jgi:polysaccharide pyruvyl transferase WcaK-like protein
MNEQRWFKTLAPDPAWTERTEFIGRFIRQGLRILDIGAGTMDVRQLWAPAHYTPVDIIQRDPTTHVVDLNQNSIPPHLIEGCELVSALGLLEYLNEPQQLLATLAQAKKPVVCTYAATDYFPDLHARDKNSWRNHWSMTQFEAMAVEAGFLIAWRLVHQQAHVIYLLIPPDFDSSIVSHNQPLQAKPAQNKLSSLRKEQRKVLNIAGFFGRGNCGDEALLQVIYETFSDQFDINICIDEHGAYPGFWDWYPYKHCKISHISHVSSYYENPQGIAGLLVGGGGLPVSFFMNHVIEAQAKGIPTALVGTDLMIANTMNASSVTERSASSDSLKQYQFIAPRNAQSVTTAKQLGLTVMHGADWALKLQSDEGKQLFNPARHVAIVLREFPLERISFYYIQQIKRIVASILSAGNEPIFLPFCPEDERFLEQTGLKQEAPVHRCWWNPREMKLAIAQMSFVVSVGRLHPLIFAATTRTPALSVMPSTHSGEQPEPGSLQKLRLMAEELGIAHVDHYDAATYAIQANSISPSDSMKLKQSTERLQTVIVQLRKLFASS